MTPPLVLAGLVCQIASTFTVGEAVRKELAERQVQAPQPRNGKGGVPLPPWSAPCSPAPSSPPAASSPSYGSAARAPVVPEGSNSASQDAGRTNRQPRLGLGAARGVLESGVTSQVGRIPLR